MPDDRDPRHRGSRGRVQQLGSSTYDAVPFLSHAGEIAGYIDQEKQWDPEGVAHTHEAGSLLTGGRVQSATHVQGVVGTDPHRATAEPAEAGQAVRGHSALKVAAGVGQYVADHGAHALSAARLCAPGAGRAGNRNSV